jgi:16S rRNA (guanine527-N7)-methyltransferase
VASSPIVDACRSLAPEYGLELSDAVLERFDRHFELLRTWNRKLNLTRILDPEEAARRHFLESAVLTRLVERPALLVDVGSGAGFPGLPLACVWECETLLVEPLVKRSVFLKEAARACGLERVRVVARPFAPEMVPPGSLLVARALDRFTELLPLLFASPAAPIALFSEPSLLESAASRFASGLFHLHPLPASDRRAVAIYRQN